MSPVLPFTDVTAVGVGRRAGRSPRRTEQVDLTWQWKYHEFNAIVGLTTVAGTKPMRLYQLARGFPRRRIFLRIIVCLCGWYRCRLFSRPLSRAQPVGFLYVIGWKRRSRNCQIISGQLPSTRS